MKTRQVRHAMAARALAAALVLAASAPSAHAEPIDFTFSGIADFELGDRTFENAAFTVRATADTAQRKVTEHPFDFNEMVQYDELPGLLSVAGLGEGSFTTGLTIFNNPAVQTVGVATRVEFIPFSQIFQIADLFGLRSPELATYDLKSDLLLEGAGFYDPMQWFEIGTSFGKLTATGFQSVAMQVSVSPVPESSTAWLFALGGALMAGAGAASRRRASVSEVI